MYSIQNINDIGLYWNNDLGWCDWLSADKFTQEERDTSSLPMEGRWIAAWEVDQIQFARLIAEAEAAGLWVHENDGYEEMLENMDLDDCEVSEIIERAQAAWDAAKASVPTPGKE